MRSPALKSILTVVFLGTVAAFSFNADFYKNGLISAFFSLAVACGALVLLNLRPYVADAVLMISSALLLALADYLVLGYEPRLMSIFSFLGLGGLAVLGSRSIWAEGREQKTLLCGLIPLLLFIFSEWLATPLLALTEKLHPGILDLYLYYFDGSLGFQPSFFVGKMFVHWPWLRTLSMIFYIGLPVPLTLIYVRHLVRRGADALPIMIVFLITGPIGIIFYNLFPAAGPIHIFEARFPLDPLSAAQIQHLLLEPIQLHAFRNAIPSLHMTWVILAWWNSKGLSRLSRMVALAFLVFTILATLGTGEHYFIDLVVAFPFALMLQSMMGFPLRRRENQMCFLFGLLTVLIWMGLLRFFPKFFWISPVVPWTFISATVIASILLKERLQILPVSSNDIVETKAEAELVSVLG